MSIKNLLTLFLLLLVALMLLLLFSPKIGEKVKTEEASSVVMIPFAEQEDSFTDIPENYVLEAGFDNVYKVVEGTEVKGYKKMLDDNSFVDYDIDMPSNYIVADEKKNIYKVLDKDNEIICYRQFNGSEWDIVDEEGVMIFKIPDNYERCDNSNELYKTQDNKNTYIKRIVKFDDGSYAWETVKKETIIKEKSEDNSEKK